MNKPELINLLRERGINTTLFGIGEAKTIEHLLKEVNNGESSLVVSARSLVRKVRTVTIFVFYNHPQNGPMVLREVKQVFKDGRERARDLNGSVFEKIVNCEDPETAGLRAIEKELGINTSNIKLWPSKNFKLRHFRESKSYPGLTSTYINWTFTTFVTKEDFDPNGYIEEQKDKTTYFEWEKI